MMMAQFKRIFHQDLTKRRIIHHCEDVVFTGDNLSDKIGVYLYDNGEPYAGGGTVSGTVINSRGQTVPITTGEISGNLITVTLEEAALAVPGIIGVYVKLTSGQQIATVLGAMFTAMLTETNQAIDPGTIIQSVTQLITDVQTAVDSIPPEYTELLAAVAPTFSASTAYTAGSYVWQGGSLYRFTADHPAGTWTGTDAVQVSLADDLGRQVSDLRSALSYYEKYVDAWDSPKTGKAILNNVNTGETVDITPLDNTVYGCQIISVSKGEKILITGTAPVNNYRLWAFTDSSYKLISKADNNTSVTDVVLLVPDDGYMICNFKWSSAKVLKRCILKIATDVETLESKLDADERKITNLIDETEYLKAYGSILSPTGGNIIVTSGNIGTVVDTTPVSNSSHGYQIVSVKKGETYKITASSTSPGARTWAFTDTTYHLLSHADGLESAVDLVLYAESDGYLICNFKWADAKALGKGYINTESQLVGKKIAWYGDSIIQNGWWWDVANHFDTQSTNCGVYGTKISGTDPECMCQVSRINGTYETGGKKIPEDADYIIIGAGTNDWAQNVPLGEKAIQYNSSWQIVEDVTTFYQACHVMFRRLKEQRPNAIVIVLGTPFGKMINRAGFTNKYGLVNSLGLTSLDYGNALCDIAEMWGYYAIRYGNKMGINDNNVETLLDPTSETGSHLHPTTDAAKALFRNAAYSGLTCLRKI